MRPSGVLSKTPCCRRAVAGRGAPRRRARSEELQFTPPVQSRGSLRNQINLILRRTRTSHVASGLMVMRGCWYVGIRSRVGWHCVSVVGPVAQGCGRGLHRSRKSAQRTHRVVAAAAPRGLRFACPLPSCLATWLRALTRRKTQTGNGHKKASCCEW